MTLTLNELLICQHSSSSMGRQRSVELVAFLPTSYRLKMKLLYEELTGIY